MGKIIITTGRYSSKGYLLKNSKRSIYSIEELCYCIMKNPELCEDYLYDTGLARFIKEELALKERGNLLEDLIERNAPLKDLITVCFCSCDYFTQEEIEEFLLEQARAERSEPWVRIKTKADSYLEQNNFRDAGINYRRLLENAEEYGMTEELQGDVYHNLAITQLRTDGFSEAVESFRRAYEKNHREDSLKQYLLALRFSGEEEDYELALENCQVPEEMQKWLEAIYFQTERETKEDAGFAEISVLRQLLKSGKINEFYSGVRRITEQIKEQYRKYNE